MKNKLGEKITCNILIRVLPAKIEHKMADVIKAKNQALFEETGDREHIDMDCGWCYWTLSVAPKRDGIGKVLFTDGTNVFAEGDFYGIATDEDKPCIEFSELRRVSYPQPKQAPSRGFTYVEVK